jgi:hypothetical protein
MKIKLVSYLLMGCVLFSCTSSKKTADPLKTEPASTNTPDTVVDYSAGDGKSYETAVVVQEKSESAGIHAEYQWIHDHYLDYHVVQQALAYHKKKPFDIITIQFTDERKQDIYFDISKFFK